MKNKKAQAEGLTDFWSFLTFALLIIIFFALFSFQSCGAKINKDIESNFEQNEAEMILLNYLRTPINKAENMADLIVKCSNDGSFCDDIKDRTKRILEQSFPEEKCFRGNILLTLMPKNKKIEEFRTKAKRFSGTEQDYEVKTIIALNSSSYVEVLLFVEC